MKMDDLFFDAPIGGGVISIDGKEPLAIERKAGDMARFIFYRPTEREPMPESTHGLQHYYWLGDNYD